jgi:Xaa-Pro aminopeptidase
MAWPDLPPFTVEEYKQRVQRAQRSMMEQDLAALMITTEMNFRYFSGLHMQSWVMPTRPFFLVIPALGEPVAVVPSGTLISMRQGSWISDVRTWPAPRPADDGVSLLRDALCEMSGETHCIGAELGPETQIRMPVLDYLRLEREVLPRTFVDASALLFRMRMVKSPAEVARIRTAAQIVSRGFESLPMRLRSGITEHDACRELQLDLLQNGIEKIPYMIAASGPGGYETINSSPSVRRLGHGDVLIIDTGSTVDGYFCDFDRNFGFRALDDQARRAYDLVFAATQAGIEAARPGQTTGSIWRAMAARLGVEAVRGASVGRMGHGLGLALTEPPSIHPEDETLLEPGMVVAIEPGMAFNSVNGVRRVMVHEENVLVTDGSPDLLSIRADPAMPIIEN